MEAIEMPKTKKEGQNGFIQLRNELDEFVFNNFDLLYEGATRIGCHIEEDYYAPKRVQIGETRLHQKQGLKYADNHKYCEDQPPTEKQLRQTVADLQKLIDAASKKIKAPFSIKIVENK